VSQVDFLPFDPTVKRTEGTIQLPNGESFKTTKGAPHVILSLVPDTGDVHAVRRW
jgi:H+-transporting ATPase